MHCSQKLYGLGFFLVNQTAELVSLNSHRDDLSFKKLNVLAITCARKWCMLAPATNQEVVIENCLTI